MKTVRIASLACLVWFLHFACCLTARGDDCCACHRDREKEVVQRGLDSLVVIKTETTDRKFLSAGTIVDGRGFIVTCKHCVENARELRVILPDKSEHRAVVDARSGDEDLALLKIETARKLVPLPFARRAEVGEHVWAFGHPNGFRNTVTKGIISHLHRDQNYQIGQLKDAVQFDAPVSQGSSGGPVLNARGEIVSLTAACYQPASGRITPFGFGITAAKVQKFLKEPLSRERLEIVPESVEVNPGDR